MVRFLPRNTDPASGGWRPIRTSRRVVLPAPFGPTSPILSPFPTSRFTSAKRRRPPWDFPTPSRGTTPGPAPPVRKARRDPPAGTAGEAERLQAGRGRLRHLAAHLLDPELPREDLLVHLAGLELLDDRELALQLLLVAMALRLPGPLDGGSLDSVVRVVPDGLEGTGGGPAAHP